MCYLVNQTDYDVMLGDRNISMNCLHTSTGLDN